MVLSVSIFNSTYRPVGLQPSTYNIYKHLIYISQCSLVLHQRSIPVMAKHSEIKLSALIYLELLKTHVENV